MRLLKRAIKPEINRKYYLKCSNNFVADCNQNNQMKVESQNDFFETRLSLAKYEKKKHQFVQSAVKLFDHWR